MIRVAPWKSALARATIASSSPSSSGTITFCEAKYGAPSAPSRNASTTIGAKASLPSQCSTGMASISGARTRSASSIVLHAPSRRSTAPPGIPSSASPISSAPTTMLIRVAEPVVTSTNHGSASHVICAPVVETTSAASRPTTGLRRRSDCCSLPLDRPHAVVLHDLAVELDAGSRQAEVLHDVPVDA